MKTLFLFAVVLLVAAPTFAQNRQVVLEDTPIKWILNEEQLETALDSDITGVRMQSLENAIIFATLYRDKMSLSSVVDDIQDIYENDESRTNRKLAMAALQAIGTRKANTYLTRYVSPQETIEARTIVASVLNDYYEEYHIASQGLQP